MLKELLGHGIEVTALHSHMLDEQPRLFFMHFWANDDAQKLAAGLRAALDKIDARARARNATWRGYWTASDRSSFGNCECSSAQEHRRGTMTPLSRREIITAAAA